MLAHILGAVAALLHADLVNLVLDIMAMNALLLPIVLGLLLALEACTLPCRMRMHGPYRRVVSTVSLFVTGIAIYLEKVTLGLAIGYGASTYRFADIVSLRAIISPFTLSVSVPSGDRSLTSATAPGRNP